MGTRFWNCVGRCSQVLSDDERGPDFQLGTHANSTALRASLLQWCYSSRHFGANPIASSGNGTSADDDRMQVDSLKKGKRKGKGKNPTPERKSHDQHDQHDLYRHQHVHELWQTWISGERLLESLWRSVRQFHLQKYWQKAGVKHTGNRERQTRGCCRNRTSSAF